MHKPKGHEFVVEVLANCLEDVLPSIDTKVAKASVEVLRFAHNPFREVRTRLYRHGAATGWPLAHIPENARWSDKVAILSRAVVGTFDSQVEFLLQIHQKLPANWNIK